MHTSSASSRVGAIACTTTQSSWPGEAPQRPERAEDGVAAIDGVIQLVARRAEALGRLLPGPGDDRVDILDRVRVAHPDQPDTALAELAGAFELGAQLCRGGVFRPGNAGRALVILLVAALSHIDVAAEEVFIKRVWALIHRMSGDRGDRAALLRPQRGPLKSSIVISPSTDSLPA